MARFHTLSVTDIQKTTPDAVVVTLAPQDPALFDFIAGQYLTFRRNFSGQEVRRSYSICAGRDDGVLQVGIKRVEDGTFSTWANSDLGVGDTLEAMPPMGTFHAPPETPERKHYVGFAGGSGITPILSILRTVLARAPQSRFTLVYANRAIKTIMFRDALEDLKNQFLDRLTIVHILEQNAQGIDLFTGRLDAEKCALLFRQWVDVASADTAYLCGPKPMMRTITDALKTQGLRDDQIKFELFASAHPPTKARPKSPTAPATTGIVATVTLDGETRSFAMAKDTTLLEAAMANDVDAPFACRAGVCSTCRAKVTQGEVEMAANHALEDGEVERGFVLTCQSYVLSDEVVFDYDH